MWLWWLTAPYPPAEGKGHTPRASVRLIRPRIVVPRG
jgi:hypothetical protein